MQLEKYISFDHQEKLLIRDKAIPNVSLAFLEEDRTERPPERRILSHIVDGNPVSREQLELALTGLLAARDVARTESDIEWWKKNCFSEQASGDESNVVSIIADPSTFAESMADIRRGQETALSEAIALLEQALVMAS